MKFTFIVFITDKIWSRYTRRPHYSSLARLGDLIIIEYPLTILSKESLKHPFREIKYYFKYSMGIRTDPLSGAKIIRPVIIFPSNGKSFFLKFIDLMIISFFISFLKKKKQKEIYFLTYYNQSWLISGKKRKKYILEMNDEWSLFKKGRLAESIKKLTEGAIEKVDLVITVTKKLKDKYNIDGKACFLPNAVDIEHYVPEFDQKTQKKIEPHLNFSIDFLKTDKKDPHLYTKSIDSLKKLRRPIVGSISGLSELWTGYRFAKEVEMQLPEIFTLVSTGSLEPPKNMENEEEYERYLKNHRTIFLGHLDYSLLPDFLSNIDIGIVMYRMNELNMYAAPNKIWAYLAMGLPVVSTNFPSDQDKEIYEGMVYFASTPEEFIKCIAAAYECDNLQLKMKRRELAVKNSTFYRAKKLVNIIEEKLILNLDASSKINVSSEIKVSK